jgi:hypothetical protein
MAYVSPDQVLFLGHNTSFEHIMSQLQPNTDKIFCVQDGYKLLVLNAGKDLPPNLKLQLQKYNMEAKTYEYHYRCQDSDSAYVIFHPSLFEWIESGRIGNFHIQLSQPSLNEQSLSLSIQDLPVFESLPLVDEDVVDSDEDMSGRKFSIASSSGAKVEENLYFSKSLSQNK